MSKIQWHKRKKKEAQMSKRFGRKVDNFFAQMSKINRPKSEKDNDPK